MIRQRDKCVILGDYEQGKTSLAAYILAVQPRSFVWDPTFAFRDGHRDLRAASEQFERTGKAVYWPGRGDLDGKFDRWCELMLRSSNQLAFVDEPKMVSKFPQSFYDLHRLGHKRGVGVATATHSIWDLPHVIQQCQHLFVLHVDRVVDLNTLRQMLPIEGVEWVQRAPRYAFWYRGGGFNGPCPPVPVSALQMAGLTSQRPQQRPRG